MVFQVVLNGNKMYDKTMGLMVKICFFFFKFVLLYCSNVFLTTDWFHCLLVPRDVSWFCFGFDALSSSDYRVSVSCLGIANTVFLSELGIRPSSFLTSGIVNDTHMQIWTYHLRLWNLIIQIMMI